MGIQEWIEAIGLIVLICSMFLFFVVALGIVLTPSFGSYSLLAGFVIVVTIGVVVCKVT